MSNVISNRGFSICRGCNSDKIFSVLDLGLQPLPAEYALDCDQVLDTFPLHLRICKNCGLGQLGEYVLPERIFHESYPYISSASTTWVQHAKKYALKMKKDLFLDSDSLVIELASNDGYLLKEFLSLNVPVLGVEPAANVASLANDAGVPTICEFFGVKLAKKILFEHGYPKLIAANNVFAHIPDMQDFTAGMALLSNNETVITIENPSFSLLLKNSLFDTVYHEHYSYLSAHSVQAVAKSHGLNLFHVDYLPTHGGSNRYYLSRTKTSDDTVKETLEDEINNGLFETKEWLAFADRSRMAIEGLRKWFLERKKAGDTVVGYGAAHKGNTFLNSVGEESKILKYVVDASSEKQGKFLPGTQVPVLAPSQLASAKPTDVLILPWNIAEELAERIRKFAPRARIWVAQPFMRQV